MRVADDCDLLGTFWLHTEERYDKLIMLKGHINMASVLVAKMMSAAETKAANWYKSFYSFLEPFTFGLWGLIIVIVLFSGFVDWAVERKQKTDIRLTNSLYEYCAGFLWGGFEYPQSRTSAVFQILLGFLVLVLISSYTANLAAFITVSAVPTKSVSSMDEAVASRKAICANDGACPRLTPRTASTALCALRSALCALRSALTACRALCVAGAWLQKIKTLYPRLRWGTVGFSQFDQADELLAGTGCDGMLATYNDYQSFRADPQYCHLDVAQIVSPALGSWVTNRQSSCVAHAISYALTVLDVSGELELRINSYVPEAGCAKAGEEVAAANSARRLSSGSGPNDSARRLSSAPTPSGISYGLHTKSAARRLTSGGPGGAASEGISSSVPSSEGASSSVPQMGILDFIGLFVGSQGSHCARTPPTTFRPLYGTFRASFPLSGVRAVSGCRSAGRCSPSAPSRGPTSLRAPAFGRKGRATMRATTSRSISTTRARCSQRCSSS